MSERPTLLEVGRVDRPHGRHGDVLVRLLTNHDERLAVGSVLDGDGAPLTVRTAQRHKDRWLVRFDEVRTRDDAEAVSGTVLRAEAVVDDRASYWVHDLIGAEVVDADGVAHGRVTEVLENPASDVLVLDRGPLVPLRFATWDDDGRLVVDGPEGLLDAD